MASEMGRVLSRLGSPEEDSRARMLAAYQSGDVGAAHVHNQEMVGTTKCLDTRPPISQNAGRAVRERVRGKQET